ncbi:MAG: Rieske 2Fe-2S domain-containing protein [Merismopedia sp. SIO2A8]|nr:Rieske 2Fe-2S domain-containing protein [Symploca sp. SIO2B6]NET49071.1 Rieske 2Fe-2S domain-containing protein [Merismopedia sp. SIO2A8]
MQPEFNFFQHWYPLSPLEDLDPKRPTPVTLLGLRLVIWKPSSSDSYRVFLDQCPHRLAPLSEGRVDENTGNLMCSYHGWQFDSQGLCTHVPQAENPQLIAKNRKNLCVLSLPCHQENDLLWVWPDASSAETAAVTPLPLSPQVDATKGFVWSSFVRDLEYDWQTLVENVADPSHVPFAHHGVQGNREQASPLQMEIVESTLNLIEVHISGRFITSITFEPPCRLEYAIRFGGDKQVGLVTYCLPVTPGKSRIVAQFPRNFAKILHHLTPRWWNHLKTRNLVLDGDMILLHQQEYFLQQRQQLESWKNYYKMPTGADRLVIEFRNWFDKYSQGKLPWHTVGLSTQTITPINNNRQFLLDRYRQHTQHCRSCREALSRIKQLQRALLGYFALTIAVVSLIRDQQRVSLGLPLILIALLGLVVYTWLKLWLEPRFYFIDYVHAHK